MVYRSITKNMHVVRKKILLLLSQHPVTVHRFSPLYAVLIKVFSAQSADIDFTEAQ